MKVEFEDGSFIQIDGEESCLNLIQCAKKDNKIIMSSAKLNKKQVQELLIFLDSWVKGNNE